MPKKPASSKRKRYPLPIERQSGAAGANVAKQRPGSKVPLPGRLDAELAREWVNQNQK